ASAGSDHTASVPLADAELTARLAQGLGEPEPCLLLNRPTSLVKGFLRQSFSERASDGLAQKLSWGLLGAALISALVSLFAGHGGVAAVNALAGALCLGGPLAATLLSAVPACWPRRAPPRWARSSPALPPWSSWAGPTSRWWARGTWCP